MSRKSRKNEAFDLPSFQMIRAASNGDIEAINAVLKHYEGYIAALRFLQQSEFTLECVKLPDRK